MRVWAHDELATTGAQVLAEHHELLAQQARRGFIEHGVGVLQVTISADHVPSIHYCPMARYRQLLASQAAAVRVETARTVQLAEQCDGARAVVVELIGSPRYRTGRFAKAALVPLTLVVVLRLDGRAKEV